MPARGSCETTPFRPFLRRVLALTVAAFAWMLVVALNDTAAVARQVEKSGPRSPAVFDKAKAAFERLSEPERRSVQDALIWTGNYNAIVNGEFGSRTLRAIAAFQRGASLNDNGVLDDTTKAKLLSAGQRLRSEARFVVTRDVRTGAQIGIPEAMLTQKSSSPSGGSRWQSSDQKITVDTIVPQPNEDLSTIFDHQVSRNVPGRQVTYKFASQELVVVTGETKTGKFYRKYLKRAGAIRGLLIAYDKSLSQRFGPVVIAMANAFDLSSSSRSAAQTGSTSSPPSEPASKEAIVRAEVYTPRPPKPIDLPIFKPDACPLPLAESSPQGRAWPQDAFDQRNMFRRLVGKWRDVGTGTTVLIEPDGRVFGNSAHSAIVGQAERTIKAGGNFAFENEAVQCVYDIEVIKDDVSSWRLTNETRTNGTDEAGQGLCLKSGHFLKVETPEEVAEKERQASARQRREIERQLCLQTNLQRQQEFDAKRREEQDRAAQDYGRYLRAVATCDDREAARRYADSAFRERYWSEVSDFLSHCERRDAAVRAEAERKRREAQEQAEAEQRRKIAVAVQCDSLAGNPDDPRRSKETPGVAYNELRIQPQPAVDACQSAVQYFPDEQRYKYQLARAYQSFDPQKAFDVLRGLTASGYAAAYDNLGWMYLDGRVVMRNDDEASRLFRRGAQLGDPDSMVSLAYTLAQRQYDWAANEEAQQLFRRAAQFGHVEAIDVVQKYDEQRRQNAFGAQMFLQVLNAFSALPRR